MTRQFEEQVAEAWPVSNWQRLPVLVAVSGGADSVALLRGMIALAGSARSGLVAAHFNHQLRADSNRDAEFVSELCQEYQVRCELGVAVQDLDVEQAGSIEEAARDARYEFLTNVALEMGARYVVTAHTADDQAETILHRILRGTGIRGLSGIPASRQLVEGITLTRPLLGFRRREILTYLEELGQPFRDDSSNLDSRYTRNRIRNELLPELREDYNPQVDESLRRLGVLADEMNDYLESVASELLARSTQLSPDVALVDLDELVDVAPLIVRTMLRNIWRSQEWAEQDMTFERWQELEKLARPFSTTDAPVAITLPAAIHVRRDGTRLVINSKGQP